MSESIFPTVDELGGVQVGDVWSDLGNLLKVIYINRNTDANYPILCATSVEQEVYHNEVHMVSDCELLERGGQKVDTWSEQMVSNMLRDSQGELYEVIGHHEDMLWFIDMDGIYHTSFVEEGVDEYLVP